MVHFNKTLKSIPRDNPGTLQCWCGKDWNLPGGVQALAGLPQPPRRSALHHAHRDCPQTAEMPDGPKERTVCLHRKVSQVKTSNGILYQSLLLQFHHQCWGGRLWVWSNRTGLILYYYIMCSQYTINLTLMSYHSDIILEQDVSRMYSVVVAPLTINLIR